MRPIKGLIRHHKKEAHGNRSNLRKPQVAVKVMIARMANKVLSSTGIWINTDKPLQAQSFTQKPRTETP